MDFQQFKKLQYIITNISDKIDIIAFKKYYLFVLSFAHGLKNRADEMDLIHKRLAI